MLSSVGSAPAAVSAWWNSASAYISAQMITRGGLLLAQVGAGASLLGVAFPRLQSAANALRPVIPWVRAFGASFLQASSIALGSPPQLHLPGGGGGGAWKDISRGLQTRRIGNFWVKRVNPEASSLMQAWGRHSLQTQTRALNALGELAVPHSFRSGMLFTRDAIGTPTFRTFGKTFVEGTKRIGFPNDIRPWNMGANGLVFDPAYDRVDKSLLIGGAVVVGGGSFAAARHWMGGAQE